MYTDPTEINYENPNSLFKYKPINKYTLINLVNDEIYMPASTELNDPFECLANFDLSGIESLVTDKTPVESFIENVPCWVKCAGIYSMSSTPFEILMWSHYSDYHRGICIEYARNPNNELGGKECKAVEYSEPSALNFDMLKILLEKDTSFFKDMFHRKSINWQYEKEWRLVYLHDPENIKTNINRCRKLKADIMSITFGLRADKKEIESIINIFKQQNKSIDFYKMESVTGRLEVRPKLLLL